MIGFIRSRVLSQFLSASTEEKAAPSPESAIDERILRVLADATDPVPISEIERRAGVPRGVLRRALAALRTDGRVEVLGSKATARYSLART